VDGYGFKIRQFIIAEFCNTLTSQTYLLVGIWTVFAFKNNPIYKSLMAPSSLPRHAAAAFWASRARWENDGGMGGWEWPMGSWPTQKWGQVDINHRFFMFLY